jgi:hypothetical protein
MKKVLLTLLCISTLSAAFPAFAGPDWQLIEQGRKAKQTQLAQAANKAPQSKNARKNEQHDEGLQYGYEKSSIWNGRENGFKNERKDGSDDEKLHGR